MKINQIYHGYVSVLIAAMVIFFMVGNDAKFQQSLLPAIFGFVISLFFAGSWAIITAKILFALVLYIVLVPIVEILALHIKTLFSFQFGIFSPQGLFNGNYLNIKSAEQKNTALTQAAKKKKPELQKTQAILMVAKGEIIFASKAFFLLTGYEPVDVFGQSLPSLIKPESLIDYTSLARSRGSQVINKEKGIKIKTPNGKQVAVFIEITSGGSYEPEAVNMFIVKEWEESGVGQSDASQTIFDMFEHAVDIHWSWDDKGIIYLNKSCRDLITLPLQKVLDHPWLLLKNVNKSERSSVRALLNEFYKTGEFCQDIAVDVNGRERWYNVKLKTNAAGSGILVRYFGVATDITGIKLAIAEANKEAERAKLANDNKTAFLANMSHELRSPLNGIIGFAELIANTPLDETEREKYLSIIQNNGDILTTMLSDLIDISKLETGKLEIKPQLFLLEEMLLAIKDQFDAQLERACKNVALRFLKNEDLSKLNIYSDPFRLRQVLVNLITNALKFTFKGRVEVGYDANDIDLLIWVKDTGIGISEQDREEVFNRFQQVSHNNNFYQGGYGLGLAISKALVELLGGHIWVESMVDRGSVFCFTIKINFNNSNMENNLQNVHPYPYNFSNHTILVAEDIDFSFLYMEALLKRTGARVVWAQNGNEAVELVKVNSDIDFVLMDLNMPQMDGCEATKIIHKMRPELPVVAQTAFVMPDDLKRCYAAGCVDYITKPIRKEQLMQLISNYFEEKDNEGKILPVFKANIG